MKEIRLKNLYFILWLLRYSGQQGTRAFALRLNFREREAFFKKHFKNISYLNVKKQN